MVEVYAVLAMRQKRLAHRVLAFVLSVCAAALVVASGLPHDHGRSTASHPQHACRLCKLQETSSATPPQPAIPHALLIVVAIRLAAPSESPRAIQLARATPPRAPPVLS